jgi:hypothetical protein
MEFFYLTKKDPTNKKMTFFSFFNNAVSTEAIQCQWQIIHGYGAVGGMRIGRGS